MNNRNTKRRYVWAVSLGCSVLLSACSSVQVVQLTSRTFPAKASVDEVEVLDAEPARSHLRLAELSTDDTGAHFESMQHRILKKAAALGADAVVFAKPERHLEHHVTYEPAYSPWGHYGPYWGPGSWGYGGFGYGGWAYGGMGGPWGWGGYSGSTPVPYDVTVSSLKGTAIRYAEAREQTGAVLLPEYAGNNTSSRQHWRPNWPSLR